MASFTQRWVYSVPSRSTSQASYCAVIDSSLNPTLERRTSLLRFAENLGMGRHRAHEPNVSADHRAFTNHGVATENGGAGIDRHVVFDRRMALLLRGIAAIRAASTERAQGDPLIHFDVASDDHRFANHDFSTVI